MLKKIVLTAVLITASWSSVAAAAGSYVSYSDGAFRDAAGNRYPEADSTELSKGAKPCRVRFSLIVLSKQNSRR